MNRSTGSMNCWADFCYQEERLSMYPPRSFTNSSMRSMRCEQVADDQTPYAYAIAKFESYT